MGGKMGVNEARLQGEGKAGEPMGLFEGGQTNVAFERLGIAKCSFAVSFFWLF